MLTLDQARSKMLEQLPFPTQTEYLNLQEAANRICAEDIISPINVPSFDNSAMDGYAVRLSDLQQSLTLSVAGKSLQVIHSKRNGHQKCGQNYDWCDDS